MAPRAHWKGYLKLSLVSCPIALHPVIAAAERISFRQVNRQTGNRLRQQLVDSVTGEVVQSHDKGRGYQLGERQLLLVEDEELEAARQEARARPLATAAAAREAPPPVEPPAPAGRRAPAWRDEPMRPETPARGSPAISEPPPAAPPPAPVRVENTRTIEIERFVPLKQIDARYFDTPYYITPRDEIGLEAYAVIRDAMRGKELVGMGRVVLSKRERPILIQPMDKGLCGMTLRYAHEVRREVDYFAEIPDLTLPDEMFELAEHILETKTADFDPAFLEDRYRTVLVSMLREKQAAAAPKVAAAAPSPQNVINLMDALKRSLETERPSLSRKPTSRGSAAARQSPGRAARAPKAR